MANKKKSKKHDIQSSKGLKEKFTELLELPKEIVLNVPKITLVGKSDLMLENYKSIIEYDSSRIRVNTGVGIIRIMGSRLLIKEITSEDLIISGEICGIEII